MTPSQIKEAFYKAADTGDASLALSTAVDFRTQGLWTSPSHFEPIEPNGTEVLLIARRPGTCVLCHREFGSGMTIRWRSRVDCHEYCWQEKFPNA